jgi:hypothetical protein
MRKSNTKILYRQRCYGKKICYEKKEAETLLNFLKHKGKKELRLYHCDKCNMYHITHTELITNEI